VPGPQAILESLQAIANRWSLLAVAWHAYFALILLALALGMRPTRRAAGIAVALPLISVAALALLERNPFNGALFLLGAIALGAIAAFLRGPVRIASGWPLVAGLSLVAFGWCYPHFLDGESWLAYLYRSPLGLIPCPTLSAATGLVLILDGLGSRRYAFTLSAGGVFYGVFGAAVLGVAIDWMLAAGALALAAQALRKPREPSPTIPA
jgi:hypothetical protein